MKCYVFVVKHLNGGPVRCFKTPGYCWKPADHMTYQKMESFNLLTITSSKLLTLDMTKFKGVKDIIFRPLLLMFNLLLLAVGNISFCLPHRLSLSASPS